MKGASPTDVERSQQTAEPGRRRLPVQRPLVLQRDVEPGRPVRPLLTRVNKRPSLGQQYVYTNTILGDGFETEIGISIPLACTASNGRVPIDKKNKEEIETTTNRIHQKAMRHLSKVKVKQVGETT